MHGSSIEGQREVERKSGGNSFELMRLWDWLSPWNRLTQLL